MVSDTRTTNQRRAHTIATVVFGIVLFVLMLWAYNGDSQQGAGTYSDCPDINSC